MNYLITSAGRGSRFLKEGIKPPKPLIKVYGTELLIWSLSSFKFNSEDKLYITTLANHKVRERLENKLNNIYPFLEIFWLELDGILAGQLLTAKKSISYFEIQGPIIIHNCDTAYNFEIENINNLLNKDVFGVIPCFKGEGDHWSFAKSSIIDSKIAIQVKEKERISNNCSVGTYIFSSTKQFMNLFNDYFKNFKSVEKSECFIAPLYQYAISKNLKVLISQAKNVKVFGTLKELLLNFNISYEELLGENAWNGHQIKTLVVDIDNTICTKNDDEDYSEAKPIKEVCEALKKAHQEGIYIILFTSRNMRSFKGTVGLINKITAPILFNWLTRYDVPYDEIYFGKPWGNSVFYIDDKNMLINDFL